MTARRVGSQKRTNVNIGVDVVRGTEEWKQAQREVESLQAELREARKRAAKIARMEVDHLTYMLQAAETNLRDLSFGLVAREVTRRRDAGEAEVDAICEEYGVSRDSLLSRRRDFLTCAARHELERRLRDVHLWQLCEIGRLVGRDHSSVLHGIARARSNPQTSAIRLVHSEKKSA